MVCTDVLALPGWAGERLQALHDSVGFHKLSRTIMLVDLIAGSEYNVSSSVVNGLAAALKAAGTGRSPEQYLLMLQ